MELKYVQLMATEGRQNLNGNSALVCRIEKETTERTKMLNPEVYYKNMV